MVGLGSGLIGSWWQTFNDRLERSRDRLLDAADDLLGDTAVALTTVREAIRTSRNGPSESQDDAAKSAWDARDLVLHRSARTELLFGSESEAHRLTDAIISDLARAATHLGKHKPDDAEAAQMDAAGHLGDLRRAARTEIDDVRPPHVSLRTSLHGLGRGAG